MSENVSREAHLERVKRGRVQLKSPGEQKGNEVKGRKIRNNHHHKSCKTEPKTALLGPDLLLFLHNLHPLKPLA